MVTSLTGVKFNCMATMYPCGAWWRIGRGDTFRPEGCGFESLAATQGPWACPSLAVAYGASA